MIKGKYKIVYDGRCSFCVSCIRDLKIMDWFKKCEFADYHAASDLKELHSTLDPKVAASQIHLITPEGKIYGGFFAIRQTAWLMPLMYPLLLVMYLPFANKIGSAMYRWIALNRYILHSHQGCKDNHCFRP